MFYSNVNLCVNTVYASAVLPLFDVVYIAGGGRGAKRGGAQIMFSSILIKRICGFSVCVCASVTPFNSLN